MNLLKQYTLLSAFSVLLAFPAFGDLKDKNKRVINEAEIWSASSKDLSNWEQKIVHQIQIDPYDIEAFYLLNRIKLRQFHWEPQDFDSTLRVANDLAQHLLELNPDDERGFIAMAESLDAYGKNAEGLKLLAQLPPAGIKITWRYFLTYARLAAEVQPMGDVHNIIKKAMTMPGSNQELLVPFLIASLESSVLQEQLHSKLKWWAKEFPHALFEVRLAEESLVNENYEAARKHYKNAIKLDSEQYEAVVNLAILDFEIFNEIQRSKKKLLSLFGDENILSKQLKHVVAFNLAKIYSKQGSKNSSHKYIWDSFMSAPNKNQMFAQITEWLRSEKKTQVVKWFVNQSIQWGRVDALSYALLGEADSKDKSKLKSAARYLDAAIALEPMNASYHNALGLAYHRDGQTYKALKSFSQSLKTVGSNSDLFYNKACMESLLGRYDDASRSLILAMRMEPELYQLAISDQDLEGLRGRMSLESLRGRVFVTTPSSPSPNLAH